MKKLITVILTLATLMISAASFAEDSPFFGNWIARKHGSTGTCDEILYYLHITKYTTSAYFELWIREGGLFSDPSIEKQEMYDGNWEIVKDHLKIPVSGISYIEVYYKEDTDTLYTLDWPSLTFARIP